MVRDNSETFTAAEATVKKKKKPVIQEKSVIRYLRGRNRFLVCRKKPIIQETSY